VKISAFLKICVYGRGFMLDCDFVEGDKYSDRKFGSMHFT
jgi:hypothetical protein